MDNGDHLVENYNRKTVTSKIQSNLAASHCSIYFSCTSTKVQGGEMQRQGAMIYAYAAHNPNGPAECIKDITTRGHAPKSKSKT